MEVKGSLLYSQTSAADPFPDPGESSLYPQTLFLYFIVIHSHIPKSSNKVFSFSFPTNIW